MAGQCAKCITMIIRKPYNFIHKHDQISYVTIEKQLIVIFFKAIFLVRLAKYML